MDRTSEKAKSSRRERESSKDHHRDKEFKSRSSKLEDIEEDDRRHQHRHRSKHRDDDEDDRNHRSDDRNRRSVREHSVDGDRSEREGSRERAHHDRQRREKSHDREKSNEPRNEREGSRERDQKSQEKSRERSIELRNEREGSRDRVRQRRERSHDREDSVERRQHSHKRKDRGENVERSNGDEKRSRVSEDKKERRRFEEETGREKEKRREKRRVEDGGSRDLEERRESRRRFDDNKVKEEDLEVEVGKVGESEMITTKKEPKEEPNDNGQDAGSIANGVTMGSYDVSSRSLPDNSLAHIDSPATKVSSISTTNENKGVNINRIHEVPGKSSTDGIASVAGKSANLSLDALAKAKRALQMRKEMAEKLKKIPALNKGTNSAREGSPHMGLNENVKHSSTNAGVSSTSVAFSNSGILSSTGSEPSTSNLTAAASANPPPSGLPHLVGLTAQKYEAVKRAQELAAKMGFRQDPEFAPLLNMFPGQMPPEVTIQPKPARAPVLRLDALGREVDEQGNVVNMPKPSSTLKVNINKKKKDAFQILKPELEVDPETNPHFDPRMGIDKTKILRPKRMSFQFVEEGKWSKDAEIIKLKSQFGEARSKELKAKQAQLAKAKAEPDINPNLIEVSERVIIKEKPKEPIPEVEWWDASLLRSGTYGDIIDGNITDDKLKMEKITIYVEHPRPIEPPAEPAPPPPQPLKLTKKEQKKLRTQRRLAREKERQEMIRQGLLEPPKAKVKMSNLMKVLGAEATQDPTKLEMEIRSAAAEREQAHVDRNIARKLTPDERREKKERKLFDDPNIAPETIVSVYKINDLSHPQTRFKVDVNARENRLTGCAVISEGITVVVVEGGKKSIKRYGKLMLKRIDWPAAIKKEDDEDEIEDKPLNKCVLVWQGSVAKSSFYRFSLHDCRTDAAARKVFADAGVPHYWDLSLNFKDDD